MATSGDPRQSFQLGVGCTYTKGPDGTYFIVTTLTTGALSQTFGIPLDQAEAFLDGYRNNFKDVVRAAKREQMGLIVANGSDVHN